MSDERLPFAATLEVRDRCLCFRAQRAARQLARVFDNALRPLDLTNGQFSLLVSLNRPEPPSIGDVAPFLGMDRTTLTAALKVLVRRGLVEMTQDEKDGRVRRAALTTAGHALLLEALPIWRETHARVDLAFSEAERQVVCDLLGQIGATDFEETGGS